ncbi:PAS domain-containing hybrid sensor histidine kinase/response regulator [Archangium lipolyticum]|uniref:PAS domain-containing hybrid sensor histidine kinase/response regulator n=1 Tax=Archangium lipolyticum TaxID=2970465 RepID=UPI002149CF0A|nr:PAS domain-containing hybrid sensor histidine kinase/response regulator [Archangium lipolyticum]
MEESAEELYESAPCGHVSTRPDGTFIRFNQTFLTWTGYSREELLSGKRFQDLLTVGCKIFYETYYAPLLRMQGFVNEINLELKHRDGHSLSFLLNSIQKKDADGRPLLNRTALFHLVDRKKYERELLLARRKAEEAIKTKTDFVSMISHEIRTPLNAIMGISNLLGDTQLSPQQEEYVRILGFSSASLLNLINNVLDFNKMDAGKVTLEERSFDVRQLLYDTVYGLGLKAEEKNLPLRVEIDEQVPAYVVGDPLKLGQILTNLVSNAIKFTEKGAVTVELRLGELFPDSAALEFRVTDTGIGIARERLPHIFEEFTQASYDINLKYGGTGLGLTISQKLLELYGTRMVVESTPGRGSSFSFRLRLMIGEEPGEARLTAETPPDERSLQGRRILVAEDNEVNVFVLSRFLRKWGIEFDVVGDGRQALEKITGRDYDLVLMDLQMPGLDGFEATRLIRSLPSERLKRLPILALSASARISLGDRLASAGFTDFIGKPFKPEELFTKITLYGFRPSSTTAASRSDEEQQEQAVDPVRPPPGFSLEKFRRLTAGDRQALVELSTITLESYKVYKREFQEALETGNLEKFAFHAHKIKVTLELMQAHALKAALQQGKKLLAEKERAPDSIHATLHTIHGELDAMIRALEEARKE